ncbi:MAG: hypothetical protein KKA73_06960 [Chloroflexi bacterium]|nr:hypothetical protein [Chloroflexota bacterium]
MSLGALLPVLFAALVALAVAPLVGWGLWLLGDLVRQAWDLRHQRRSRLPAWLAELVAAQRAETGPVPALFVGEARSRWDRVLPRHWQAALPLLPGLLGALWVGWRAPLIAAFLLGSSAVVAVYLARRGATLRQRRITDQVAALVPGVRSRYAATPSLREALAGTLDQASSRGVAEIGAPVRPALAWALSASAVTGGPPLPEALFQAARQVRNESLRQLALVFWHQGRPDDTLQGLDFLADLLARRQLLHGEADGDLMALKLTARVLMGFCLLTVGLVLAVPWWFDFYTSTLSRQGLFMGLGALALGVSLYFDRQLLALEERLV